MHKYEFYSTWDDCDFYWDSIVEIPIETPVETPVERPVETPVETPVKKQINNSYKIYQNYTPLYVLNAQRCKIKK